MIDRARMYGTEYDSDTTETANDQFIAEATKTGTVMIETNGKKIEVVSVKEYEKTKSDLEDAKKQIKMMKTEIQNMKRFINKMAKATDLHGESLGKLNERFYGR